MTRLSADKDDPGYAPYMAIWSSGRDVKVFANDKQVKECITVDLERRYIKYYVLDDQDKAQIDPNDPNSAWIAEMNDVDVRIEFYFRD